MTPVVADANVLLRLADSASVLRSVTRTAIAHLRATGYVPQTVPQAVYEFWVVATRPVANNGLGLGIAECERQLTQALALIPLLDDRPNLFAEWRSLVAAHACRGKPAHDARYVAAMNAHGVTRLLTFNTADFARYPRITVLDPRVVATAVPPTPGPGSQPGPAP